jgi:thioredoxin 1
MSENLVHVTDADFEEQVLQSEVPVLVDFWAEWCAPCIMIAPTIEELAKDYGGRLKVAKVDTDSSRDTAMKFDIRAIPTLLLFKDGEVVHKFVGLQQKADLKSAIDEALG